MGLSIPCSSCLNFCMCFETLFDMCAEWLSLCHWLCQSLWDECSGWEAGCMAICCKNIELGFFHSLWDLKWELFRLCLMITSTSCQGWLPWLTFKVTGASERLSANCRIFFFLKILIHFFFLKIFIQSCLYGCFGVCDYESSVLKVYAATTDVR